LVMRYVNRFVKSSDDSRKMGVWPFATPRLLLLAGLNEAKV
jgi:hypothetical protein